MAEGLGATASVVGIVVPALHGVRLLFDDLKKIIEAPEVVASLATEVEALRLSLESLKAIDDSQWETLGKTVSDQCKAAITTCTAACDALREDLHRWTKRSADGKLSWRDRANIGFFKERQIKARSEQLQSYKLTLNSAVGAATLRSTLRSSAMTETIQQALSARRADNVVLAETTDTRIAAAERSLAELGSVEPEGTSEDDDGDVRDAEEAVQQELAALQALQAVIRELQASIQQDKIEELANRPKTGNVTVSVGRDSHGVTFGTSSGPMTFGNIGGGNPGRP